ncbi:hypothetical protein KBK19_17655 [Microvirga sp. STR05]|uniref:Uncharacterized protein n=1 Tax=Hymenobacter duratus TaxID=2771356 RepID=A0ABR8JQP2_9BACT|nr:hypothetical protein [Hymenobacter duratus]MBD2716874.1 hypothetical protein [Hymenobacter duratus]MBR7951790.1 hypothetical protein [Microvirga sp. STR05]
MKRFLLAALLTGSALTAQAQQPAATAAPARTEEYCQLNAQQKLNGKITISVDYGQQQKFFSRNLFRDAEGRPVEFNSVIDALNWLNSQGWEFLNAYVQVEDGSSVSHYVMRRRIPS